MVRCCPIQRVVDNLCFCYYIEYLVVIHEGTDAFDEVDNLDVDIPQKGVAIPSFHDHYSIWIQFGHKEFYGKPLPKGVGSYIFV